MRLNRRKFLQASALATVAAAADLHAQPRRKVKQPNVLYIFSDQHRAVSLPGGPYNQSIAPNLDSFRRANLSMERCVSNYPLCTPYRGILMSGRWPQQTGLMHNGAKLSPNEISLGETFRNAGYHTGYIGKWHLSGKSQAFIPAGPDRLGFEDWHVWNKTNNHYHSWTYDPTTGEKVSPEGWNCTRMTDQAVTFLETQPKGKPWLLMVSWNPPHPPFNPPEADTERYPAESLKFRPNARLATPSETKGEPPHPLTSWEALRRAEQGYYGGITGVDLEFARLMQALEQSGQADNTIVVYTSDHGEMMGSQGRMAKQVPFEESCRVPFFIRYPGVTAKGGSSKALFAAIDIYPTLCGLADIPIPPGRGGRDLSGIIRGHQTPTSSDAVFLMNQVYSRVGAEDSEGDAVEKGKGKHMLLNQPSYRGVRTSTHTYAVMETGRWVLYDNIQDPYQMHNLVNDPAQADLMKTLDARLVNWLREMQDSFPYQTALERVSTFPS